MWATLHSAVMGLEETCCDFTHLFSADCPQCLHSGHSTDQGRGQRTSVQPDLTEGGQGEERHADPPHPPQPLPARTQPVAHRRPAHGPPTLGDRQQAVDSDSDDSQQAAESGADDSQQAAESGADDSQQAAESGADDSQQAAESGADDSQQAAESGADDSQQAAESGADDSQQAAESGADDSQQCGRVSVAPSDGSPGKMMDSGTSAHHHTDLASPPSPHPAIRKCMSCHEAIRERYLIQVQDGRCLHERCVACQVCPQALDPSTTRSVFLVGGAIFCRHHYTQMFTTKRKRSASCAACREEIRAGRDWVRLAGEQVYHVTCFACSQCGRQFASGALFVLRDGRPVCPLHLHHSPAQQGASHTRLSLPSAVLTLSLSTLHYRKHPFVPTGRGAGRVKRTRTQFTAEQYGALQRYFRHDSNPDSRRLDTMARELGLVKRHVQVWFQNNRARQKKLAQSRHG